MGSQYHRVSFVLIVFVSALKKLFRNSCSGERNHKKKLEPGSINY